MNKLFTFLLFLSLGFTSLQAQLETAFIKTYDDGFIDTIAAGQDLIRLSTGNFALASRQNNGSPNYFVNIDLINSQGELLASAPLEEIGTANSVKVTEAADSTIWVVYDYHPTEGVRDDRTRIVQFSSNLDSVLQETDLNLSAGAEFVEGILAEGDQLLVIIRGVRPPMGDELFFQLVFSLYSIDTETLLVDQQLDNLFPLNSFSRSGRVSISLVEPGQIGFGIMTRDSNFTVTGMLIQEVALADFSLVDEYTIDSLADFNIPTALEYLPGVDAYATTGSSFDAYLIKRGTGSNPTIDTIAAPEGISGDRSNSRLSLVDSTLYMFGRNAYRIDFTNDTVSSVSPIGGFNNNNFRLYAVDSDGNIVVANNFTRNEVSLRVMTYVVADSAFADTLDLVLAPVFDGVRSYYGVSTIPALLDTTPPLLAIGIQGQVDTAESTHGYEIVNANTGELTGQAVSTGNIEFWAGSQFFDPRLNPLVSVGGGYMGVVTEFNRFTFFKFSDSLQVFQPNTFGATNFDPLPNSLEVSTVRTAPTSYGVAGVALGRIVDENFNTTYKPYVFSADTNFVLPIQTAVDTFNYVFSALAIIVDSLDRPYIAGFASQVGNPFNSVDTINVIGHEADGSIRFATQVSLSGGQFPRNISVDLNNSQTELLVSGVYRDTASTRSVGFLARLDVADGSVLEVTSLAGTELGYSPASTVSNHKARYDVNDNIVLALLIFDNDDIGNAKYDTRLIQIDTAGNTLANSRIVTTNSSLRDFNFHRIGEAFYASGWYSNRSGLQSEVIIAKINTGLLTSTKETPKNVTESLQLTAFPNPVNDQVSLTWEQPKAGDYVLQLFDMTGRTLSRRIGNQSAGTAQIEVPMGDLPKGPYFIRLDVADGYMVRTIVKQ